MTKFRGARWRRGETRSRLANAPEPFLQITEHLSAGFSACTRWFPDPRAAAPSDLLGGLCDLIVVAHALVQGQNVETPLLVSG